MLDTPAAQQSPDPGPFQIMLSHLAQIASAELHSDCLLQQVNLIQAFHSSIDWLIDSSETDLEGVLLRRVS